MESPFGKTVSPHFCNCTKRDAITGVFLWIDFVNTIFSLFILLKHLFGHVLQNRSSQKFRKTYRKTPAPEFIFLKKLHHQACNFVKKRLQHRCFTVNFAKWLKALCRVPPVSASNFSSTPSWPLDCAELISTFSQVSVFFLLIFLSHFMFLIEARNKSIWCYTKFSVKQALFLTS